MKNRISKILGLGLALVLTLALVAGFALPVAASPGENEWQTFAYPDPGSAGDWFRDADIRGVGPMAEAINGDLYAYVEGATTAAVAEVSTVTLSGSPRAGDVVTVTIDGNAVTYTVLTTDIGATDALSLAAIAAEVAAAINADATVSAIVTAASAAAVVTLTADVAGLAGAFTLACGVTGITAGTLTATPAETQAAVAAVAQISTLTIGGAGFVVGDVYNVAIQGYGISETGLVTADAVRDALITDINARPGLNAIVTASSGGAGVVNVTADVAGLAGAFTITASVVNAGASTATITAATPTPAAAAIAETSTVTLALSPQLNDVVTVIVDGNSVAYTVVEADIGVTDLISRTNIALKIAAAINADATVSAIVTAAAAADVVTLTAVTAGVGFTLTSPVTAVTDSTIAVAGAETVAAADAADVTYSLYKSTDGGRSWEATGYEDVDLDPIIAGIQAPGAIVDMVCSSIDEDILYVTDGNYVYKSTDAGDSFSFVARDSLEEAIMGTCGITITEYPITCIDVGYDDDEHPFVFIGTEKTGIGTPSNGVASVLWIGEAGYQTRNWTDLKLLCYGAGYVPYAVGCPPNFADSLETFVVVSDGDETHVISTVGVTCSWDEVAELVQDCKPTNHFGISAASRIGFPDDWEDTETLFVGVVDDNVAPGGDVYSVTSDGAIDRNVEGIKTGTGCVGLKDATNIISLDVMGDTDEASLIAGAYDAPNVYYSTDGGWSWDVSAKNPTGDDRTYVLWYGKSALAATSGDECAVSLSCGKEVGEYWNQISLIATDITTVKDISHSPGYVVDSETLFMLTISGSVSSQSLFRYDGTYWERVYCSTIAGADETPAFEMVAVSPDFNDTNAVFVANNGFEIWRSLDAGCSWKKMTFPCATRPTISAWVVIDEDTVITGGEATVYKTERHGARPWQKYDVATTGDVMSFDLEPGYDDPGTIILGDSLSQVFISEDGGEEWELVGDCADVLTGTNETSVVFDPTSDIIYAAAGYRIARCVIDWDEDMGDQEWDEIYSQVYDMGSFWGIVAAGDTALYVGDRLPVMEEVTGDFVSGGVLRSLNPDADDAGDVVFERLTDGLTVGVTTLMGLKLTTDVSDDGCAENVLWSLDLSMHSMEDVWVYEDTLAAPVVLGMPVDGQKLTTARKATLSWNELCGADCYEVSLYAYCAECPDEKLKIDICGDCGAQAIGADCYKCVEDTCIVVDGLESGTTYYWQVRVCIGQPYLSKWSEERTFTTALLDVPKLCSPVCGGQEIILTPNFSWDKVSGATGYNIELATTQTFTAGVVRGKSTVNAWVAPAPLEYATTYYWRVRAEKDGVFSDWSVCIFTTMEKPVAPTPPVTITPAPPAPQINIPPAQMITPNWIYAIIAIGAALCVVVIALIVRTRRPPA